MNPNRMEQWGALGLSAFGLVLVELFLCGYFFGNAMLAKALMASMLVSTAAALSINLAPTGHKGKRAFLTAGVGMALAMLSVLVLPREYLVNGVAISAVAMLIGSAWVIPQMALQMLLAKTMIRLLPN